ncbi:hypothetical protein [Stenotrophomonas sp.]|uniref:hypothetical protein n=1 Tax=Stenotrophomonas sp. TaxID=69392 RepID=UPI0028ABDBE2|nr:hypothetical protein [Stenotrophomonas sp.]
MNHNDARAEFDEFAAEISTPSHIWNHSKRLDALRTLEILSRRALRLTAGLPDEAEHRHYIEAVLDRIRNLLTAAEQLDALRASYRH